MHISKLINSIKSELMMYMHWSYFLLSVVSIVFLCFLGYGYMSMNGSSHTILEMVFSPDKREIMERSHLSRFEIWRNGLSTWTILMIPMLISIGSVVSFTQTKSGGLDKWLLLRQGRVCFCISRVISSMLYSGIVMSCSYLIFGGLVILFFPATELEPGMASILLRLLGIFFYGMLVNTFSFVCTLFFMDKYILMCIPVMLKYGYDRLLFKLFLNAMSAHDKNAMNLWESLEFENIISVQPSINWAVDVIILAAVYIASGVILFLLLKKRGDSFELE